jgi:hypothetical protein
MHAHTTHTRLTDNAQATQMLLGCYPSATHALLTRWSRATQAVPTRYSRATQAHTTRCLNSLRNSGLTFPPAAREEKSREEKRIVESPLKQSSFGGENLGETPNPPRKSKTKPLPEVTRESPRLPEVTRASSTSSSVSISTSLSYFWVVQEGFTHSSIPAVEV